MIGKDAFVKKIEEIAARKLSYRIGGLGADGTCDCIGLIMGAMLELGHGRYDLHSTNYFARYQMTGMEKADGKALYAGEILYRAREDTKDLHARYQAGGRYYTGDLLDYYHVGVVTGVNPLRIIECTQYGAVTGIVISGVFRNWHYGGKLRDVLYDGDTGEQEGDEARMEALYQARVTTQKDPLMLRDAPGGKKTGELPKDAVVDVLGEGEWMHVRYGGAAGYASAQYLTRIGADYSGLTVRTILTDGTGGTWEPVGGYSARTVLEENGIPMD
ncbi:MAG: SH3 domain-containing protein [Clostridia bacterium]|nr:SH3 domain-containing protein [Clostridia bacterium]